VTAPKLRAHKIRMIPAAAEIVYFNRCTGTSRYAFNWSLSHSDAHYREHGKLISDNDLKKAWNAHRKVALPWSYEVTKHASDSGVLNFCAARANWFRDLKKQKVGWKGRFRRPRLKSKHRSKKSFTLYEIAATDRHLIVPKLGPVKMTETVRFPGKIKSVTISEQGGHWFASFLIELSEDYVYPHRCETQAVVGIDVGLNAHLALSTGEKMANPKFYRRFERRIKRAQRALSRKKKGSKNRQRAIFCLARLHDHVGDLRADHLHQMTTSIVRQYRYIGLEDLGVTNMLKNHSLSRALSDANFGEIRRQIEYKAEWAGGHVAIADRFYPSSKLCSACGHKNEELTLADREWTCPECGTRHDRDVNAARNLEKVACGLRETLNACVIDASEARTIGVADVRLAGRFVPRADGEDSGMSERSFARARKS
jgi:putative transposase